jgi:hypothetical protein
MFTTLRHMKAKKLSSTFYSFLSIMLTIPSLLGNKSMTFDVAPTICKEYQAKR